MDEDLKAALLKYFEVQAQKAEEPETPAPQSGFEPDKLAELLAGALASLKLEEKIETAVQKALPAPDRDGVGRKGDQGGSDDKPLWDTDPVAFIVQKAESKELSADDKKMLWQITAKGLAMGLEY